MNKKFLKEHFIDDESMEEHAATLKEASELQSKINNVGIDPFDDLKELLDMYEQLICVSRILYLAVFYAKEEENK